MAKLYFRYGAVGSAKTLSLLAVAHSYRQQDKKVLIMKPHIDTRTDEIESRCGLKYPADYLVYPSSALIYEGKPICRVRPYDDKLTHQISLDKYKKLYCILIDECQFLEPHFIDQLYFLSVKYDVPVIFYGLKNNFKNTLFTGTKRILELCDSIEEIKSVCWFCNNKATHNLKFVNNCATVSGPEIELGYETTYKPVCKYCYVKKCNLI